MAILFNVKAFDASLSGTATTYSSLELDPVLARAARFFVAADAGRTTGTSPTLTLKLEGSNDRVNWTEQATFLGDVALSTIASDDKYASDAGSGASAAFARLSIKLGGTNPSSDLQIWVCGRTAL